MSWFRKKDVLLWQTHTPQAYKPGMIILTFEGKVQITRVVQNCKACTSFKVYGYRINKDGSWD